MVGLEIRKTKAGLPGVLRKGRRWLAGKYREVPLWQLRCGGGSTAALLAA